MFRQSVLAIALGLLALTSTAAMAQPPAGQQPRPLQNLQIIPKDTPRAQVIQIMQSFTSALGVRCEHCHVDEAGRTDFAADDRRTKNIARAMMRMTEELNGKIPTVVGKSAGDAARMQCATCHRGVAIPKLLTDIMTETMAASGMPAAAVKYRELRKQYYGGQSYDFSEAALAGLAQRANQANKPDDAIALLQLNLEFNPQSSRSYALLGAAYAAKNDSATAIKDFEKALEIDPKNEQARQQLERLKK